MVIRGSEIHPQPLDTRTLEAGAKELGVSLDAAQLDQFRRYYLELVEWNSKMNLTTVTDWEEVQKRHFLDSLALARAIPSDIIESGRFVDVGAGAGFPGLPVKIAFPNARGVLVEATARKVEFLRSVIANLSLDGLEARHGRAETLAREEDTRGHFDMAFARAVAPMPTLAELTLPFCRVGGLAALHKTSAASAEIESAGEAICIMGGRIRETIQIEAAWEGEASNKTIILIEKTRDTPAKYPRRPGIPAKRPLTG